MTQLKSYLRLGGAGGEDTCHWNRNRPRPSDLCPSGEPMSTGAWGTLERDKCRNINTNPLKSLYINMLILTWKHLVIYVYKCIYTHFYATWYATCIQIRPEDFTYLQVCGFLWLLKLLHLWQHTRLLVIAEIRGCKVLKHKTEVSSSVWAKRQIGLRCLEGLDEAVLLSVSQVNEVIFNRELIIWHNGTTEQAAAPLDQILPITGVMQQTKEQKIDLQQISQCCKDGQTCIKNNREECQQYTAKWIFGSTCSVGQTLIGKRI